MKETELAVELDKWFQKWFSNPREKKDPNIWNRNPVGKVIKSNLKKSKNWKKRGLDKRNASFGWEVKEYNRKVKYEGYKGPKPVNF